MVELCYVPLKELSRVRAANLAPELKTQLFAALCRINTLYMIKMAGSGHIGSSFSAMDIVSWLYLNELGVTKINEQTEIEHIYFSSKGHDVPGLYSVLIGLQIIDFDYLHKLRRLDGLPGHPDIQTLGISANTGSLGMGISKAKGMIIANRLNKIARKVYVLTGDGELQEGQFWESLQGAANHGLHELVAIIDHNKIQSDTWVKQVSDLGALEEKLNAFGWHVLRCNGHDIKEIRHAFRSANDNIDKPSVIIADTVKGCGVSFMQQGPAVNGSECYQYHSGAPSDEDYEQALKELLKAVRELYFESFSDTVTLEYVDRSKQGANNSAQHLITAYSRALLKIGGDNPDVVVLDADLVKDCGLIPFKERFPERFLECGIAEQDMISQAGGLALAGKVPIVHSFACFLSTRPNEQIYNNASELKKVVYVGSLAGLLPAGPGHSHQSVRDITLLAAIPGMTLLEPCDETETEMAVDYCLNHATNSCYLRLVSVPCEIGYALPQGYKFEEGIGVAISNGDDALLFSYGPVMLTQAYQAAKDLVRERGIGLKVINLPWLNVVNTDWLESIIALHTSIFTLEDHYLHGGQGDMLISRMAELGLGKQVRIKKFGLNDFPACGTSSEVLERHRLDARSLSNAIYSFIHSH